MANYFTLEYESTANTSPSNVELNYGAPYSDGLTVQVDFFAGSGFTPTHYKMWGLELVQGEGVVTISGAEWLEFTETRTARLARHNDPQCAYVVFKDVEENETSTFQSNFVTFSFVEPTINSTVTWKYDFENLGFEEASFNTLKNTSYNTEVEFSKNKLSSFYFSNQDFSGLKIDPNTVYINTESDIGKFINLSADNHLSISKQFSGSEIPFITVDYGNGFQTLSTYDLGIKTTVSGNSAGRISNIEWNAETKTLTFDVYKFSTYGFCFIQKVEFTNDSQTGVYVGNTATFKVYVQDSNGEPIENAPVTVSGISGNIGSIQESMPVLTDESGLAEFNLSVTSAGQAIFEACVDDFTTDPNLTINGVDFVEGNRSLLTQYEQIYKTATYDDSVADVNSASVAEPTTSTVSGSADSVIEHDLNVLRTIIKQVKGTTNWYDDPGKYFDPTDTDVSNTENKTLNMANLKNNTLDSVTIILAVSDDNSGAGFDLVPGNEGFLFNTTSLYATPTNRIGLPIYKSVTNSGTYYDEGGLDRVVGIDLINTETGSEFKDSNNNIIFGRFHDGADHSGSGNGTDVYIKFYTDEGEYTTVSGDPSSVMMIYPYRKLLSNMEEYEWSRTDFISSWEGDEATVEDIVNLWGYTGALNNESFPAWSTISGSPLVNGSITNLKAALDAINTGFGNRSYTEQNYLTNSQSITDSIDALDTNLYDLSQSLESGTGEKYVVIVSGDIDAGTSYQLPDGVSYTPASTEGQEGKNMDIILNGQLLSASTGINGINEDKDYSETDTTHVTFHLDVYQYSNLTFIVRA